MFVLMSEPAQKCENNAIFKQKLYIAYKMTYSWCFSLGEIQIFEKKVLLDRLQEGFQLNWAKWVLEPPRLDVFQGKNLVLSTLIG